TATVTATPAPAISVVKSANPTIATTVGDIVAYTFVVTNTGNVTLSNVSVVDTFTAPAGPALTITCPGTTLTAAGTGATSTMTCTASHTVTAAEITNGVIGNSATASGTPPVGAAVTSAPSTATVVTTVVPALTVTKTASPTTVTHIGDTVAYTFVVANAHDTTLTGVSVVDAFTAPAGPALTVNCPATSLTASGTGATSTMTCTATYVATAADFDTGAIVNTATASGLDPAGVSLSSPPASATVAATQVAGLGIIKSANPTSIGTVGSTVGYSFVVTNTGNVTLTGVSIADTFTSPAGPALSISCPATSLTAAGTGVSSTMTCTATYTSTSSDFATGTIVNTAAASGTAPNGLLVTSAPSSVTVTSSLSLPPTGSPLALRIALAALAMLVAGAALVLATRRRVATR
ncbi:MAG TPA: hypothetical protein VGM78_03030, partial [Ilumatobacteraceae bacterium]